MNQNHRKVTRNVRGTPRVNVAYSGEVLIEIPISYRIQPLEHPDFETEVSDLVVLVIRPSHAGVWFKSPYRVGQGERQYRRVRFSGALHELAMQWPAMQAMTCHLARLVLRQIAAMAASASRRLANGVERVPFKHFVN